MVIYLEVQVGQTGVFKWPRLAPLQSVTQREVYTQPSYSAWSAWGTS